MNDAFRKAKEALNEAIDEVKAAKRKCKEKLKLKCSKCKSLKCQQAANDCLEWMDDAGKWMVVQSIRQVKCNLTGIM